MHILFIIDPIESLSAYKDSSVAMMRALLARGHKLSYCLQGDLYIINGKVLTSAQAFDIPQDADLHQSKWWQLNGNKQDASLSDFDAVLMRKDPPFDLEYLYSTHLLDLAEEQGARVFNTGLGLRNHPEKLAIAEFPEYTAPTLVSRSMSRLRAFYDEHDDIVIKPLDGMGGTGIFRVKANDGNFSAMVEMLTAYGTQSIMAQKFIPDISAGDKRILIINGEPIPYVLARIPKEGENRGNLAAGGRGVAQPLNDHDRAMAKDIAKRLEGRGLFLIGLDVIGKNVTEINVTSPTCFVEITEQTDFHVGNYFVEQLEKVLQY
ncbi:MAG: glutathione synthase [Alcaligenaceae bacterium]|nr:glutathione synthase [Alcaligenaceae bacterium]